MGDPGPGVRTSVTSAAGRTVPIAPLGIRHGARVIAMPLNPLYSCARLVPNSSARRVPVHRPSSLVDQACACKTSTATTTQESEVLTYHVAKRMAGGRYGRRERRHSRSRRRAVTCAGTGSTGPENRQLNTALHTAAIVQARDGGPGRQHYDSKSSSRLRRKRCAASRPARQRRVPAPSGRPSPPGPSRPHLTQRRYESRSRPVGAGAGPTDHDRARGQSHPESDQPSGHRPHPPHESSPGGYAFDVTPPL